MTQEEFAEAVRDLESLPKAWHDAIGQMAKRLADHIDEALLAEMLKREQSKPGA